MDSLPSRQSVISLKDITAHNWEQITRLVVNKDQIALVPTNLHSLCGHQFYPGSIVLATYADQNPVGYIRLVPEETTMTNTTSLAQYVLLAFMIDQRCQGLGFGSRAMKALKQKVEPQGVKRISLSTKAFGAVPEDDSPEHFFTQVGFVVGEDPHQMVCVLS